MKIYLIGLPGVGKSRIGKKLAEELKLSFLDLDVEIEKKHRISPAEMIKESGEAFFRDIETKVLKETSSFKGVIACGGGIVLRQENLHYMMGKVIYLESSPSAIKIDQSEILKRPILQNKTMTELFFERECDYLHFSNLVINVENKSDLEIITLIRSQL